MFYQYCFFIFQEFDITEFILEGSFSDSGISDEGSEHDLGERERRLAAIRRLIRQLECVMAPDCTARVRMSERLLAAEEELKNLQMKCKSLIERSGVTVSCTGYVVFSFYQLSGVSPYDNLNMYDIIIYDI